MVVIGRAHGLLRGRETNCGVEFTIHLEIVVTNVLRPKDLASLYLVSWFHIRTMGGTRLRETAAHEKQSPPESNGGVHCKRPPPFQARSINSSESATAVVRRRKKIMHRKNAL